MRIVFIGCVESSRILLDVLLKNRADIAGVITKENSGYNTDYTSLAELCQTYDIEYIYVKNVNEERSIKFIRQKSPDVIYCFGWSQLIKEEILSIPPMGCIGFHPAALPSNRGKHPIIWALALGLDKTASSFFKLEKDADTGFILSQKDVDILYEDDARSLYDKIMRAASEQVIKLSMDLEQNRMVGKPQKLESGNTWRKRGKDDGKIDWRMSAKGIYNLVRALTKPYAGAHFQYGDREYKVWKAEEVLLNEEKNIEPGKVLRVNSSTDFYVKVYDGVIHVMNCDEVDLAEGDYL